MVDFNTFLSNIEKYIKKMAYMFDSYDFKFVDNKLKTKKHGRFKSVC